MPTINPSMQTFEELWSLFGDVAINDDDDIIEPFLDFPIGTDRFEIWHWFEAKFNVTLGNII